MLSINFSAITCSLLGTLANGMITYDPDTTPPFDFETTATYSCDTGYGLSPSGTSFRSCLGSPIGGGGQWTGRDSATCDRKELCVLRSLPTDPKPVYSNDRVLTLSLTKVLTFLVNRQNQSFIYFCSYYLPESPKRHQWTDSLLRLRIWSNCYLCL